MPVSRRGGHTGLGRACRYPFEQAVRTGQGVRIVTPTDVIAIGLLHAANCQGMAIPDDVSVAGFDDIPYAASSVPALTTVRMPTEAMAVAALDLVIGSRSGAHADERPLLVPELVLRASTGPVRPRSSAAACASASRSALVGGEGGGVEVDERLVQHGIDLRLLRVEAVAVVGIGDRDQFG